MAVGRTFHVVSPRIIAVATVVVMLGSVLLVAPLFDWQPHTWQRLIVVWRERCLVVALPLLLVSAWQGRSLATGLLPLGGVGGRRKVAMLSAFAWRLGLVGLMALVPALSITIALVATAGTGGSLPVLALLASVAGIATAVPLGLALGASVHRWAWPLSVSVLGILIWYAPMVLDVGFLIDTGMSSRALSLSWGLDLPTAGTSVPAGVSLVRVAYFLVLSMLALAAYSPTGIPAGPGRKPATLFAVVAVYVAVVLGVAVVSPSLPLVAPDREPMECRALENTDTEVCLFPSHESVRGTVTSVAEPLSQMVGPRMPATILEGSRPLDNGDAVVLPVSLAPTEEEYRQVVAADMTRALVDYSTCQKWDGDADTVSPEYVSHSRALSAIQDRLIFGSGVMPPPPGISDDGQNTPTYSEEFTRLQKMADQTFGHWYQGNYDQIMACDISSEDLP